MNSLLLLCIALLWGSQFVLMEISVAGLDPFWLALLRAWSAVACLSLVMRWLNTGKRQVGWWRYQLLGLVEVSLPFLLLAYAQQQLAASMSSVIMGLIPIMTLVLAPLLGVRELGSWWRLSPILLGFAAIFYLFWPELQQGVSLTTISLLATLAAAACFALGAVLIRLWVIDSPLLAARNIIFTGALQLSLLLPWFWQHWQWPGWASTSALLVLGTLSTGLVYVLFTSLIRRAGATFAAFSNYLVPPFGLLLALILLNQQPSGRLLISLVAVLLAVALDQWLAWRIRQSQGSGV